jgi:hypothetical protein
MNAIRDCESRVTPPHLLIHILDRSESASFDRMDFPSASGLRMSSEPRASTDGGDGSSDLQRRGFFLPTSELPPSASQEQLLSLLVALARDVHQDISSRGFPSDMLSSVCGAEVGPVNVLMTSIGAGSSFRVRAVRNLKYIRIFLRLMWR